MLDGSDVIVGVNTAGRAELDRGEFLNKDACERLHLTSPIGDQKLTMTLLSVRQAMEKEPGRNKASSFLVPADGGCPRMIVHVLGLGGTIDTVAVMVPTIVLNQNADRMRSLLSELYGLTPAEARLGTAMLAGHSSAADLALALGRSEWTVRSQIRTLFVKLEVSTKTEAINRMSLEVLPLNLDHSLTGRL
ncbi:helix-turn-helix transcriptional regulator [Rhodospirillum sp. A1_3_36]|uniref:helix-turn-helix transcriptional regulator n=1 Tax=Rhodospirillum sp. A1_3_36 TaxID=3391666 RepID=UPI0039A4AF95